MQEKTKKKNTSRMSHSNKERITANYSIMDEKQTELQTP